MSNKDKKHKKENRASNNNPFLPWVVFFSLLLTIASGLLIYLVQFNDKSTQGIDYSIGLNAQLGFDCDFSEAQRLYPFSDGLMKVTASRVAYLSITGNEIYTIDLSMEVPFQAQSDNYFVVADQEGFSFALFDKNGLIYQRHSDGMISFVTVSEEGCVALITDTMDAFGSVSIFDPQGNRIAFWTSYESGYPLSLDFSPNARILNISLVDINRSQMQPIIKQLYIPEDYINQSPYELAHFSPDISSILSVAAWIDDQTLMISGISDVFFSRDGYAIQLDISFSNIVNVFSTDFGVAIIHSDGVGKELKIDHINSSLGITEASVIGHQLKAYATDQSLILIAIDSQLVFFDINKGHIDRVLEVDEEIIRLHLRDGKAVLVTISGVREISI